MCRGRSGTRKRPRRAAASAWKSLLKTWRHHRGARKILLFMTRPRPLVAAFLHSPGLPGRAAGLHLLPAVVPFEGLTGPPPVLRQPERRPDIVSGQQGCVGAVTPLATAPAENPVGRAIGARPCANAWVQSRRRRAADNDGLASPLWAGGRPDHRAPSLGRGARRAWRAAGLARCHDINLARLLIINKSGPAKIECGCIIDKA